MAAEARGGNAAVVFARGPAVGVRWAGRERRVRLVRERSGEPGAVPSAAGAADVSGAGVAGVAGGGSAVRGSSSGRADVGDGAAEGRRAGGGGHRNGTGGVDERDG